MEPEQTPFAAVTVHTSRLQRVGRIRTFLLLLSCWAILSPPFLNPMADARLFLILSNTKRCSTSRLPTSRTDGLAPASASSSSSLASSLRRDGTSVRRLSTRSRAAVARYLQRVSNLAPL